ncbi:MAG: amidohydrolase [Actinobacteria bacterium]|nr:MAG: amidohydrolase [Actinomycetota bacterium]
MSIPQRDFLIRGAWVLTMGAAGAIRDGAVRIADGRIQEVGPYAELSKGSPDIEVVGDGTGIVMPGLINAHTHLSEALVTGMGSEFTLFEWGHNIVTPVGENIDAEMAEEGVVLKAAEMLRSGVTYVNDMFVHSNPGSRASLGVVQGLVRAGLKGSVSLGAENALDGVTAMEPMSIEEIMDEQSELAESAEANGLDFRYGIGTLLGQTDELLQTGVAACQEFGWGVHTHLAEVREEVVHASLRWGVRTIDHAEAIGLLDFPVVAGHGIWVRERDVATLATHGVTVAHNPVANMILGSGVCPVQRLRSSGIPVGIGTDGAASNDSQNMLEAVKVAALLQKVTAHDPSIISAEEVLAMATIEGARGLGIDDDSGSLEGGKEADVVLLQGTEEIAAIHDPYQQVVYASSPQSVSDVWVAGRHVVVDRDVVTIDRERQMARSRELAAELAHRSGLCQNGYSSLCTMH